MIDELEIVEITAVISIFIVFKICYRDNSLTLKTFRTTHVIHFLHKYCHPYNVERASSATSLRYDRTRSALKEGQ